MSQLPQLWLSYRRQCQQTLHPTSAHSDCEQSLQPIDWQGQPAACLPGGPGPRDVYTSGWLMGHVVHLPPIPQHPRTPGHKAFRSQLTANELGGIRFAGVGPKWSTVQPRSAKANPLWQPRALGIWGRHLPTKIPYLFLKSTLRQDELRQTNGQGIMVRQYPKHRSPIINRVVLLLRSGSVLNIIRVA